MKRRKRLASHANHERWLVSYADFVTLLFAFFVVLYSTSQVDKKKVGHLASGHPGSFQEMGVFPASNTQIPVDTKDPMPFSTVQAVETAQRVAAIGRIVNPPGRSLSGAEENGDLSSLQKELQQPLAPEISRREVALRTVPDGLVISLREIGFFESGRRTSSAALNRPSAGSHPCWRSATIAFKSRVTPTIFPSTIPATLPTGNYLPRAPPNWSACS